VTVSLSGVDLDPDIATLLASGERATFHGPPASAIANLERAVALAQRDGRTAEVAAAAWLLGVALSASGRYGDALTVLVPLLEAGEGDDAAAIGPEIRLFASLAAATAASVHRGLGRHPAAAELDSRGLALTEGPGEASFDCVLGLTADSVGGGSIDDARNWLMKSEAIIDGRGGEWWRQRVRLDWARAEVALLAESPEDAIGFASTAVAGAEAARAPRHVAKSLLFQGVAELQSGQTEGVATLKRAASLAEGLGAVPLIWQARALVGALLGGQETEEGSRSLAAARSAVLAIAGSLPQELRDEWLERPNVSAVLEG
jgi:hypothetical protein